VTLIDETNVIGCSGAFEITFYRPCLYVYIQNCSLIPSALFEVAVYLRSWPLLAITVSLLTNYIQIESKATRDKAAILTGFCRAGLHFTFTFIDTNMESKNQLLKCFL
jgi:hypothetical protein